MLLGNMTLALHGMYSDREIADIWIYKIQAHPQKYYKITFGHSFLHLELEGVNQYGLDTSLGFLI